MKLIKTVTLLLVASSLFACQKPAPPKVEKAEEKVEKSIGLQLYSLRDDISASFDTTITDAGAMGYKYIEAANYSDGKFYGMSPEEFKSKIEAAGMTVLSSHTSKSLDNVKSPKWDEIWAWWDTCIDAHVAAGAKYIVTPWMDTPKTLADLKVYCDYYNQIGERCNKKGIRFGYHNHDFEFKKIEDVVMYDYMIENTKPEFVCFEMDVYWTVMGQKSPVEYFQKYPGRFELLHIKDHKELGESGMVGFDAIYNHAKEAGLKYPIVEVEQYNHTPKESVKMSYDYLMNAPFVLPSYAN